MKDSLTGRRPVMVVLDDEMSTERMRELLAEPIGGWFGPAIDPFDFIGPPEPAMMVGMDFGDLEDRMLAMVDVGHMKTMSRAYQRAIIEGMAVVVLGVGARQQSLAEMVDWPSIMKTIEPITSGDYDFYREPVPKPPKGKLKIHQAPRQSFRKTMRSVNRNR